MFDDQTTDGLCAHRAEKSLTLGEIELNPFRFELDMRDIAIADPDDVRAGRWSH